MITNERQYQISKVQVAKFRAAIDAPESNSNTRKLHPRAQKVLREAAQSQLDDLMAEVNVYESLRDGQLTSITAESIAELAPALINARIIRNWTQKELADKLAVAEQQIQRYEATLYEGAGLDRIQQVANVLGMRERVMLEFSKA